MSFSSRITRLPRKYHTDILHDEDVLVRGFDPATRELIINAASSSPHLNSLLGKEAEWLCSAVESPETALVSLKSDCEVLPAKELFTPLRQAKRRVALLTALADLGGVF